MAIHTHGKISACSWFGMICGLLCILIPALTFYGQAPFDYVSKSSSTLIEVITSPFSEPTTVTNHDRDEYLAICLAVRDQGLDLPEFLQHHYYNMGIRRFYIMDEASEPPISSFQDTFKIPPEALTFVYYNASERVPAMQYKIYNDCAGIYGKNHTWVAFVDADEFFDNPGGETLEQMLRILEPLDHVGALGVNWQMHTSNGQLTRVQSVRKTYTQCIFDDQEHQGEASDNKHIKSIVRVKDYAGPMNPHKFHLAQGKDTVGEHMDPVNSHAFRQPITRDRVSLHHYAVKSKQEYEQKMLRGNAMAQPKDWGFWDHVENELEHVECADMVRWVG